MTDLSALLTALAEVPADQLPEAIGALEAAKARAWARLTTPTVPAPETHGSLSDGAALDVDEVARRTRMSVTWLYRQARAGHLPFARRIGRRLVFDEAGLQRWLDRRRTR
jgi:excisionase family DNA binding protein